MSAFDTFSRGGGILTPPERQVDLDDNLRIWRSFKLGKLMDLIVLDTRNYDRSITGLGSYSRSLQYVKKLTLTGYRLER
ncbi:alkaline phosphatase D family protein [Candidatus Bathyarchaeota archaeon]|nr:alkaline phosphatase D family protein [Candidatus Bathyarchaeota archaeon]